MHITTIATANMDEKLLLAATLVQGYPAPLSDITDTRSTNTDSGSVTRAKEHLAVCR